MDDNDADEIFDNQLRRMTMSNLYNTMFGTRARAAVLLALLELKTADIPRFRDAYLDSENHRIVVLTRTGGGNRADYESLGSWKENNGGDEPVTDGPWNSDLRQHPLFDRDADDDFDSTYAHFHFKFPTAFADDLKQLCDLNEVYEPSTIWNKFIEKLEKNNGAT